MWATNLMYTFQVSVHGSSFCSGDCWSSMALPTPFPFVATFNTLGKPMLPSASCQIHTAYSDTFTSTAPKTQLGVGRTNILWKWHWRFAQIISPSLMVCSRWLAEILQEKIEVFSLLQGSTLWHRCKKHFVWLVWFVFHLKD